jgi:hypothetical protein
MPADARERHFRNAHRYLAKLKAGLKPEARRAWEIVARTVAEMEAQQAAGEEH